MNNMYVHIGDKICISMTITTYLLFLCIDKLLFLK